MARPLHRVHSGNREEKKGKTEINVCKKSACTYRSSSSIERSNMYTQKSSMESQQHSLLLEGAILGI